MNSDLALTRIIGEHIDTNDDYAESANLTILFIPTPAVESAIGITLEPGLHTAILNNVGNTEGVGIVDVFDAE